MSDDAFMKTLVAQLQALTTEADQPPFDVKFENGKAYLYGGRLHAQIADFRLIRGQANAKYISALLNAAPLLLAAATQAQAAAERAAQERDEAYASLTACSEAGIQVTRQKNTYRNRALALLRRMSLCRFAHRSNVDIWIYAQSRAIAAEARADKLAALLDRAWDYISDNAQHEIQCACVQVAMADCTCKLWPLTADIAAALPTVPDGETK